MTTAFQRSAFQARPAFQIDAIPAGGGGGTGGAAGPRYFWSRRRYEELQAELAAERELARLRQEAIERAAIQENEQWGRVEARRREQEDRARAERLDIEALRTPMPLPPPPSDIGAEISAPHLTAQMKIKLKEN